MSDSPINFPKRQLPAGDEVFLDHVGWMTHDMDKASAAFERLGFVLTPYSEHGDRDPQTGERRVQGSANRLAMLPWGYLEILCAVDGVDTPVAQNIHDCLARYEGLHLVAFAVADADGDYARLEAAGTPLLPMVNLRRDVEAADGSDAEVAFSVVRPVFGTYPEGRMQVLTHHTPDHMWQDRYIARDNHLEGLTDVWICVEDPASSARALAALTRQKADGGRVEFARGRVDYLRPEDLAQRLPGASVPALPFMAAVGFKSRDLAATAAFFEGRGIGFQETGDGSLAVDAADGLGCTLTVR